MILPQSLSETGLYFYADGICMFYQHEHAKKMKMFWIKSFRCYARGLQTISYQFILEKIKFKSILISKAKGEKKIHIYFAGQSVNLRNWLPTWLETKWRNNAFQVPKEKKCQFKIPVSPKHFRTPAFKRLLCNALIKLHFIYESSS